MTEKRRINALRPEQDERVRVAVREILTDLRTQAAVAKRLGFSQQTVGRHLGGVPAGPQLAEAVARATGRTYDELVHGISRAESVLEEPSLSTLPGWDAAEALARKRFKHLPEHAWTAVRGLRTAKAQMPRRLTPEWIGTIAGLWTSALDD